MVRVSKYRTFWASKDNMNVVIETHEKDDVQEIRKLYLHLIERRALDEAIRLLHNARYFLTARGGLNGTAKEIDDFLKGVEG